MSYFTRPTLCLLFISTLALYGHQTLAETPQPQSDEIKPSNNKLSNQTQIIIPQDSALDSDGKPLHIPKQAQSAIHYQASEAATIAISLKDSEPPRRKHKSKSKPLSRKQQLASRLHVANDPSCRWLNKRMQQLEHKIKQQTKPNYGFHSDELSIRKQEWICMKCGAEGPQVNDHASCQHRR
ncbi:hypothetical protein [Shewanella sp. Isolate11]|uniref:hypothetical protein n=1 Tax=Shewanella sp. Isolate11 TaxID=2908530 RepID=UPI001EFE5BA1|nr:hypothetical protein [Shewanella sp. Isolate11]MCG9697940.1 hypothetical protein [Shewanella sp. Isolate11]